jgi:hypothetical protein
MKEYPTIEKQILEGNNFYCFDKLDGSNVRCEFNIKKGFTKFGSRTQLFDERSNDLGKYSIPLIKEKEKEIIEVLKKNKFEKGTCFFEFYGPSSFAGNHNWQEQHKVVLIDVWIEKKGMIDPKDFIELFSEVVETPKMLYYGPITEDLIQSIKTSSLEGISFEGVICKTRKPNKQHYCPAVKIKTTAWLEKLRSICKSEEEFEKLA